MVHGVTTAIQAISNHFNVAINVMSSQMVRIVPWNGTVDHKVYIGLVLQHHFVGLDKLAGSNVECDAQYSTSAGATEIQMLLYFLVTSCLAEEHQ